jgi:hypothetical protein
MAQVICTDLRGAQIAQKRDQVLTNAQSQLSRVDFLSCLVGKDIVSPALYVLHHNLLM